MSAIPRIGIDAMGGDLGSGAVVEGVALAFREMPGRFEITLVGDEVELRAALKHARQPGVHGEAFRQPA